MKDLKVIGQEKKIETIVLNRTLSNKDVIQSYILTTARYDLSVYEKRILYGIVECFQAELTGKKIDKDFSISPEMFGDVLIEMSFSLLLVDGDDKNHYQIKKALYSLLDKKILRDNDREWEAFTLIVKPKINKYDRIIRFRLHEEVYEALLDFSKGYRKYELKTAMAFNSIYSMRFYELLSGQKKPLTYSIEDLKAMFRLEKKYKDVGVFRSRVIDPAQRELDLKSPYSFTYQLEHEKERTNPKGGRKKVVAITFTPVYRSENRNSILEYKDLCRTVVLSDVLLPEEQHFFVSLGFTEQELKSKYYNLLIDVEKARRQGRILITPVLFDYAKNKKNPKTYALKALRNEIRGWKEELSKQNQDKLSKQLQQEVKTYHQDKQSIHYFLKDYLGFSGEELDKAFEYVSTHGDHDCLDELIHSCNKDKEKMKASLQKSIQSIGSVGQRKKALKAAPKTALKTVSKVTSLEQKEDQTKDELIVNEETVNEEQIVIVSNQDQKKQEAIPHNVVQPSRGSYIGKFIRNGMKRIRNYFHIH
ncbi:replication initiation protein [Candidatus Azobacteroides pseudotrichonymphae]|uniref:Replication protein A n=1 Tax=Azobacteroides pseudotrichonymphae genomovar. CFP2 TaxID=511995 RepID=B6YS87_AZOPC|nr:replication initiation protein [Candidatus Azobacteroides pseudotrichonymphae]BAG84059.1 replication protein A [Candidatus Azobacteroides pseudotrichonymphae genomovar. CFP2]